MKASGFASFLFDVAGNPPNPELQQRFVESCRLNGLSNMADGLEQLFAYQPKMMHVCCGRTITTSSNPPTVGEQYITRRGPLLRVSHYSGLPVSPGEREISYAVDEISKRLDSVSWYLFSIAQMTVGMWDNDNVFVGSRDQQNLRLINETVGYLYIQRHLAEAGAQ